MAKGKQVASLIKLQVTGGQATPAPPVGPVLGQHGVNIGEFVQRFNAETSSQQGVLIPVEISVYSDRSFDFILKSPPAAVLIKKALGMDKAANNPGHETVGTITLDQVKEIVEAKEKDLNAASTEAAVRIIAGTARSMGVSVEGMEVVTDLAPLEDPTEESDDTSEAEGEQSPAEGSDAGAEGSDG